MEFSSQAARERFTSKTKVSESGCWLWTGCLSATGYGFSTVNGKTVTAHRLAYQLFKGPIPEGMKVLHSCDVRCCVNPSHLSLGTSKQNSEEMVARGRAARGKANGAYTRPERVRCGETHGRSTITKEQAFYIRYGGESLRSMFLSGDYKLSLAQLQRIRAGLAWKDLPEFHNPVADLPPVYEEDYIWLS